MSIVQIHAAWPNFFMLHVHFHTVCPCPCCMSMSMLHIHVNVHVHSLYIDMPECQTVRHPVSLVPDWKKLRMLTQVRYRTKLTQSGIFMVRYRIKIRNARMPMPALVSLMPMPSFDYYRSCIHMNQSKDLVKISRNLSVKILMVRSNLVRGTE